MPECIKRDFRTLRLLVPLFRSALPGWDLEGVVDELRDRMLEECDYTLEAAAQAEIGAALRDDAGMVVPRVFPELCTARVLVSEHFAGKTFADFASTAPQGERDRAAETIIRYVVRTTVLGDSFNTDMHPGNLLFADDRVCFVDFGNVRRWPSGEGECWRVVLEGLLHADVETFGRGLRMAGLVDADQKADFRGLHDEVRTHLMRSVVEDRAQRIDKRLVLREMRRFGPDRPVETQRMRIPPLHVYGFRVYWGMFAVVADLQADVNARRVVLETLARGR
jgi:predicted unusual protein kinase regulating ubiquinone biosynthesis (AarF/ABC1/UbiB family)